MTGCSGPEGVVGVDLVVGASPRAYVYAGEWVADCPRPGCGGVEFLVDKPKHLRGVAGSRGRRKDGFFCSHCRLVTPAVEWPVEHEDILAVLERRPIPHTRNWYPEGHPVAVRVGIPHGQTVADLERESREHGV